MQDSVDRGVVAQRWLLMVIWSLPGVGRTKKSFPCTVGASGCLGGYPEAAVGDSAGWSIEQFCPYEGSEKNHGKYVFCVAHETGRLFESGRLSEEDKDAIVSAAGQSQGGKATCGLIQLPRRTR